jgi:type I restriction enzyme S subunit
MNHKIGMPQLRFLGFEGNWEIRKLGELTAKIGDGLHGTPIYSEDSDIYFINGNNLTNGKIEITEKTKKVDYAIFTKNDKGLNENTILISLNGTIGNIAKYNNEKVMLGKSVGYYNFKENTDFYYHIFHTDKIQNFFISELTGSTIKNLSLKTLRETIIPFPTLPEQQKIASFLSAVDEKIQQISRKKKLLEQYKKGLMQQLFSGKLRFKDENGNDYADWEEKKLGDLVTLMQSGISRMLSDTDIGLPIIRSNNLQNRKIDITDIKYWYEIDDQGTNLENYVLCEGDLLVNFINSIAQIGKVAIFSDLMNRKTIFTTNLMRLRFNNRVSSHFMINYFQLKKYEDFIQSITKPAVNQASFTTKDFKTFIIHVPSIPEQQKIVDFLSGIDAKIESTNQQITQTQSFKKGLLQQLFV